MFGPIIAAFSSMKMIAMMIAFIIVMIMLSELALVPMASRDPNSPFTAGRIRGLMAGLGLIGVFLLPFIVGKMMVNDSKKDFASAARGTRDFFRGRGD